MSDLTATNCGCNNTSNWGGNGGCSWIIWILLLSCFCGGNGGGCGFGNILGGNSCGCGCDDNNNSCEWLIWILLIICFCGGNNNSRCC